MDKNKIITHPKTYPISVGQLVKLLKPEDIQIHESNCFGSYMSSYSASFDFERLLPLVGDFQPVQEWKKEKVFQDSNNKGNLYLQTRIESFFPNPDFLDLGDCTICDRFNRAITLKRRIRNLFTPSQFFVNLIEPGMAGFSELFFVIHKGKLGKDLCDYVQNLYRGKK